MGVPKFYRWISERYPCLSETVKELQIPEFDNLYLDMNGIIHTCSHPDDGNAHFRITLEKILEDVCHYIEFLYRIIKPKKVFFMAIDGVAPRAKMNQQRGRRFRSAREAEECERKARESGEILPAEKRFDSNCITPGTEFMVKLHEHLKYFVVHKISTDPLWQGVRIYLSGHETPGEGEHKIMDFIRHERSKSGYDQNTRHCLYGLDADLMMLGLATHEPHFSLLREEVKFGGKNSQKRPATPEETTFHLLHLSLFREYLDFEFSSLKDKLPFGYDMEKIIDDWVLMGFLVGNDFIPNLPHLHIRHDALPLLWKTYMSVLPTCGGYLNEGGHLNLVRFEKYLDELKKFDVERFNDMYTDLKWFEGKKQNKEERSVTSPKKSALDVKNQFSSLMDTEDDIGDEILFGAGPDGNSTEEQTDDDFDTFDEEFLLHKRNYYETKLEFEQVTPEVLRDQAEGYVRAIQWILLYYYEGVPSWSWFYPHHYAPYISDVTNFSHLEINFDLGKPFYPFQQLMAVLPAASKDLLPDAYKPLMTNDTSPVVDFYPVNFETDLNDKQQEWEAVVLIPFIDEERLLRAMASVEEKLTPAEKARNKHGPCLLSMYTTENQGPYPSPMPDIFPDLGYNYTFVTELFIEDFYIEEGKLRKGILPDAKLDVYYPGFPTLKHIQHIARLKKANVKVFQMNSRGENMMLQILGSDEDRVRPRDLEDVARDYVDEIVYVGWPHLFQAKVISVSDDENRYVINEEAAKNKKKDDLPKMIKEPLSNDERSIWHREVDSITVRYHDRQGIDVGPTFFLIKALPVTGKRYGCEAHGRIILEKQYSNMPVPFVLQATVKNISVHDPSYLEFRTLSELFPVNQSVFMLGSPHYGCQGEVLEVDESESPRVRINVTIPDEPCFQRIENRPEYFSQQYFPGYSIAQRLGISSHFLSRITGSIFIKKGSPDNSEGNVNIGLNLKFTKRNEEVPGYTKLSDNGWTYSEKAMKTIGEYLRKFPELWDTIIKQDNKSDNFFESDVFGHNGVTLKDVSEYLKMLPCTKIKTMKAGADILDEGIVAAIENEVEKVMENNKKRQKRVKMQVKPHLLFRPIPNEGSLIPDPTVTFMLFDRVVNVRQGYTVPFGLRGTIVGVHKAEKESDTMYEVVFDEEFQGGIKTRCNGNKGYRVPKTAVINLSHGDRKYNGNTGSYQNRQKFSQQNTQNNSYKNSENSFNNGGPSRNLSGRNDGRNYRQNAWENNRSDVKSGYQNRHENSNWNNDKGGYPGAYQDYNDRNKSNWNHDKGGYSGGYSEYNDRNRQVYNGHVTDKSNDRQNKSNNESARPKLDLRQESFDESQKNVPLQFVTPKVVSPGRNQSTKQQSDTPRAIVTKMFQEGNSCEFADMWNELQKVSPTKKSEPSSVNKLPVSTSVDIQSLFAEASKSNIGELASKLKDLTVSGASIEDGVVVCSSKKLDQEKEDGSAALRQMLHINQDTTDTKDTKEQTETKESASYGRQLSVQELFDGVKQKGTPSPDAASSNLSNQLPPAPVMKTSQPNQYNQGQQPSNYTNQTQQQHHNQFNQAQQPRQTYQFNQGQQPYGRPKSGGMYPNQPNVNVPRNPVMQLLQVCRSSRLPEPKYEFSKQMHGQYLCVIYIGSGQRFQGAVTVTQEAAAESAASIALLSLGAPFHQHTAPHPLMMMQQQRMMHPPPLLRPPNMPPQPNQQFSSAFRPVQPAGGTNYPTQNYQGGRSGMYGNQQNQDYGRQKYNKQSYDGQSMDFVNNTSQQSTVSEPVDQQSPPKQSNPFIPLQVTKQKKTPQKKKEVNSEDGVNNNAADNMSSPEKSEVKSPPRISYDCQSRQKNNQGRTSNENKRVIDSDVKTKKTPPKQQTPSKRKSRLAANFGAPN